MHLFSFAFILLVTVLDPLRAQTVRDTAEIATLMLQRMQLQRGERVLIAAIPGRSDALITALRSRIRQAGAVDLGVISGFGEPDGAWMTEFTRAAPRDRAALATYLASVDLAIMTGTWMTRMISVL